MPHAKAYPDTVIASMQPAEAGIAEVGKGFACKMFPTTSFIKGTTVSDQRKPSPCCAGAMQSTEEKRTFNQSQAEVGTHLIKCMPFSCLHRLLVCCSTYSACFCSLQDDLIALSLLLQITLVAFTCSTLGCACSLFLNQRPMKIHPSRRIYLLYLTESASLELARCCMQSLHVCACQWSSRNCNTHTCLHSDIRHDKHSPDNYADGRSSDTRLLHVRSVIC